ncbi:MAG: hypothetical protein ACHQ9S_26605 [Candidatus Binatia bacterium]
MSLRNVRCSLADCLVLLDDMHASIRADYVPGALALLDADPDLRGRFDATEARIYGLAKVPGGPDAGPTGKHRFGDRHQLRGRGAGYMGRQNRTGRWQHC